MPRIYMNEEGQQVAQSSNNNAPIEPPQDHTIEYNSTDVVVQGSKGSVIRTHRYTFVFSQALQDERIKLEEFLREQEEQRIADEKQAIENARLNKNAKARMRRHLNKTFDKRVAVIVKYEMQFSMKLLRESAKMHDIDTKGMTKKADIALAIATLLLKDRDDYQYTMTNRDTNFDALKGDAQ
jgi:hypothetical protein